MNHFEFTPTPIHELPYYSTSLGIKLIVKRDDLFPEYGGGNKARMLQYILPRVLDEGCEVLVTAGGPCSNFNRVCALMCSRLGIKMHLIEYTDNETEWESLNYYICNLAGITKTRCSKLEVASTTKRIMDDYAKRGVRAINIYGGGKCIEGFYAYYESTAELFAQTNNIDHLFIACGTGTTLTGICAGFQKYFPNTIIHAISVARPFEQEINVLIENMESLNKFLGTNFTFYNLVFHDEFLCGGYARYSNELFDTLKECICKEGILIDPTYSGKAFWGMTNVIKQNPEEYAGKRVLFWNTGGMFNLLSTKYDNQIG